MEGQMHINIVYCIGIGLDIEISLFQQIPFLKCALNLIKRAQNMSNYYK